MELAAVRGWLVEREQESERSSGSQKGSKISLEQLQLGSSGSEEEGKPNRAEVSQAVSVGQGRETELKADGGRSRERKENKTEADGGSRGPVDGEETPSEQSSGRS